MEDLRLKKLQQCAIQNVMARISDAYNTTAATGIGELNFLHVAASMDIEKTTESLNQILAYKKEAAKQMLAYKQKAEKQMLRCSDGEQMKQIAQIIKQADIMIGKVLGMYVP